MLTLVDALGLALTLVVLTGTVLNLCTIYVAIRDYRRALHERAKRVQ